MRVQNGDDMNFDNDILTKATRLYEVKAELETLLPDVFEKLKKIPGMNLTTFRSHHDYVEILHRRFLSGELDAESLNSNWIHNILRGKPYTKDLYNGACYQLVLLLSAKNLDRLDEDIIEELSVNMQLIIPALQDLSTMEILSPKDAAIEQARAGGLGRARHYVPAKAKLLELLASNAPTSGWATRSEAIKAIDEPLGQFIETNELQLRPEALISTVARWARDDPEIAAAFERHVKRKPKMRKVRTDGLVRE